MLCVFTLKLIEEGIASLFKTNPLSQNLILGHKNPGSSPATSDDQRVEDEAFYQKLLEHMRKRKRKLFFVLIILVTLVAGYSLGYSNGASSLPPIQKPNQTIGIQLLNGVQVNSVTVTDWTLNTVQVVLQSPAVVTGTLTVTTDNAGTGSTAYSLTVNTPATYTVTVNAALLAATLITVKT